MTLAEGEAVVVELEVGADAVRMVANGASIGAWPIRYCRVTPGKNGTFDLSIDGEPVVFEPNDEPLWTQIRLNLGSFMHGLFRQGAFQGKSPREAYFVKCDRETTTQADIDQGVVNIVVGFAPLKPAEFVIIQLQQIAGQLET